LWEDIEDTLINMETWCSANNGNSDLFQLRKDLPFELKQFAQFNRAGLWATGL